ncbi:MAG: hypothetical protein WCP12_11805 [bacterium]
MRGLLISIVCIITFSSYAFDYQKSLDMLKSFQEKYSDGEGLAYILELAKSDSHPEIVSHAMAIYTLHNGSKGDSKTFLAAFKSVINRYPNSEAVRYLKTLPLLPEPCSSCSGTGLVDQQQKKACTVCNATGSCKRCNGTGQLAREGLRGPVPAHQRAEPNSEQTRKFGTSFDLKCITCGGNGRCKSCGGVPIKEYAAKATCTICNGITKEVNAIAAKDGLIRMTQSLWDILQLALDCEALYSKAMAMQYPLQQLEAAKNCVSKYSQAINIGVVKDALHELSVKAEDFQKQQKDAEQQRLKLVQQHEVLLYAIENVKTPSVALRGIEEFIQNNPKSPVMSRARLLRSEIEVRIEKERSSTETKRYIIIGVVLILVIGFLSWIASCIQFK